MLLDAHEPSHPSCYISITPCSQMWKHPLSPTHSLHFKILRRVERKCHALLFNHWIQTRIPAYTVLLLITFISRARFCYLQEHSSQLKSLNTVLNYNPWITKRVWSFNKQQNKVERG